MHPRSAPASFRDRTNEFRSAVESARRHVAPSPAAASASGPLDDSLSAASAQSEFKKRASEIGLGIHQTSQKLARLAKLAKRTSVFDDPTLEIQELTAVVRKDIGAWNNAVMDLQVLCNSQNESGNLSKDTTNHSITVVDDLKNLLMSATKEFREVLTMRTENLKVHENRRQMFTSSATKDASNPFMRTENLKVHENRRQMFTSSATKDASNPFMQTENLKVHENRRQMFTSSATKDASNPFMRTENLKVHENRRQMFTSSATKDASNPFMQIENLKVHENRRQMFTSSATKDASNPFMRTENLKVHENRRQMFTSSATKDESNPFMQTENLKVHENRRQMFTSSATKDASNPFMRQRPLVAREGSDSAPPAPWASNSETTPLFQSGEVEQIEWSKIQKPTDEVVVLYDTLAPAPEDIHATKALQGNMIITAKPGVGSVLEKDGALFQNMVSPPYPKSSARGGGRSHLSCASPFSVPRFIWTENSTVQLFEYYAKDIESSGSICFESLTQKLRDNGVQCNIKNVREKIKNEKRNFKTWIDSNQSAVKNKNIMKNQFSKEPKHLNLMRRMFQKAEPPAASGQPTKDEEDAIMAKFLRLCNEPARNIEIPSNEVITSTTETTKDPSGRNEDEIQWNRNDGGDGGENEDPVFGLRLLVDGIERLCVLTDEIERAGLELVRAEREDVDNISIEIVEQLSSAYTLAVAAAKATPSDNELIRVAVEARLKLAAAIHQPD